MYIDSHAHVDHKQYEGDREAVIARAREAGLRWILAIGLGTVPGTYRRALDLAEQHEWFFATTGLHPQDAASAGPEVYAEMVEIAKHPKLIAWGEIGLDYYYPEPDHATQRRVFIEQMELAAAAKKPLIIHCRPSDKSFDAWDECLALLREHWRATGLGGVLHCFTGQAEHARAALELGFLLSFAGNITYKNAPNIRAAAALAPDDGFLIETDCPYLAPVPHRGKRNEPALVIETARCVGEQRGISGEEAGALATANFERFFGLGAGK